MNLINDGNATVYWALGIEKHCSIHKEQKNIGKLCG
jgi:hypothetical protein